MKVRIKKDTIICVLLLVVLLLIIASNMRPTRLGKTDYYLADDPMPLGLYYQYSDYGMIGVLDGRITDIYWNEQYILATQCDVWSDSVVGYYIVKKLPLSVKKGVPCEIVGSLSKEEYEQKKQELFLNEREMKHTNLFDNKHKTFDILKLIAVAGILSVITWCVLRRIIRFLKSKIQEQE